MTEARLCGERQEEKERDPEEGSLQFLRCERLKDLQETGKYAVSENDLLRYLGPLLMMVEYCNNSL